MKLCTMVVPWPLLAKEERGYTLQNPLAIRILALGVTIVIGIVIWTALFKSPRHSTSKQRIYMWIGAIGFLFAALIEVITIIITLS